MNKFKSGLVLLFIILLAGCGGNNDVPGKPQFTALVSFGDSLSDVGSYQVGPIAAVGGGQFTINAASTVKATTPTNWTEFTSLSLGQGMPCAALTGGFGVATTPHAGCYAYGEGGSRVTDPAGVGNAGLTGSVFNAAMTIPVVTQISDYLASAIGNKFTGNEIVYVMAGANDVLVQLNLLSAGATAAGNTAAGAELAFLSSGTTAANAAVAAQIQVDIASGACIPIDLAASNCVTPAVTTLVTIAGTNAANTYLATNAPLAGQAMATAATELIGYVNTQILGNGAKYVTVINIPDIKDTPDGQSQSVATQGLIDSLVTTFNSTLMAGVDSMPQANVLYVDAYTASKDEVANPAKYNLTNITATACNLSYGVNILAASGVANSGSSLVCNANNLNAGVSAIDHYLFADTVHPTPYGHLLFATYVLQAMTNKGWY